MKYSKVIKKIAEELNTFLKNIVSTLDIDKSSSIINQNFPKC